jgi:hypothetical protein
MKYLPPMTALAVTCLLALANPAAARVFPGGGGGGGAIISNPAARASAATAINNNRNNYGDWGGGAVYMFNNSFVGAPPKQQGPTQSMLLQNQVSNTMIAQGQERTQAIASQRQSYKDWWFQTQQQQSAARPAAPSALSLVGNFGFEPDPPPKAAMDVIQWPVLLQRPTFASRRTLIEAPYRRTPPKLSAPTAHDYREMIPTIEEMKDILEWLTREGVDTNQYNQAKAFLNLIEQEARQRAAVNPTSPQPKS